MENEGAVWRWHLPGKWYQWPVRKLVPCFRVSSFGVRDKLYNCSLFLKKKNKNTGRKGTDGQKKFALARKGPIKDVASFEVASTKLAEIVMVCGNRQCPNRVG